VRLLPHPEFTVKGDDLESELVIAPWQAALGDKVTAATLDGPVSVTVPAGTHAGRRLRLRGKGLLTREGRRGDQYLKIVIDIPEDLSERERELYRQLSQIRRA
jgi:curved DNA-binding protein